jgi:hypothetical protein
MPNYTYTTNIPLGTDNPSDSASQFNENFTSAASIVNVDLYGFNNNFGGTHQQVTFPIASPTPSPTGTIGVLYSLLDAGSASQLWFQNKNGSVQLTGISAGDQVSGTLSGTGGGNYTVFTLPFGFRIFTGQAGSASGSRTLTMSASTFGATIYTAVCSPFGSGPIATSITPNAGAATFNIQSANAAPLYFLVITT